MTTDDPGDNLLTNITTALDLDFFVRFAVDADWSQSRVVGNRGLTPEQIDTLSQANAGGVFCAAMPAPRRSALHEVEAADFELFVEREVQAADSEAFSALRRLGADAVAGWRLPASDGGYSVLCFGTWRGNSPERLTDRTVAVLAAACEELHSRAAEAGRRTTQFRRLVLQLSESEDRERRRLADFLHDDLQQTLAGVKVHVDMAMRHVDSDSYEHERLATADELLREVIELSRTLSHELRPVNLRRQGLIAALTTVATQMKKSHGLEVEISSTGGVPPLNQTAQMFVYRAVRELLFNVVKHAGVNEAHVTVKTGPEHVVVTVRDHGRGFDVSRRDAAGDGLGLISMRERLEAIGGTVEIESATGKGSRFTIRVPVSEADASPGATKVATSPGRAGPSEGPAPERRGPTTILLVDDHAVIRQGLAVLLEEEPDLSVVAEADSGEAAIEAVERFRPDVVVMDFTMPGMDGDEATRAIKRQFPDVHVIGLSMHAETDAPERMLEAGADVYLPKTGASENVIAAIRRVSS